MMLRESVETFVAMIIHLCHYSEDGDGSERISSRIKQDAFFRIGVDGIHGHQHETRLRDAGVSQHSLHALLEYGGNVSNEQRSCCEQRHPYLPPRMQRAE